MIIVLSIFFLFVVTEYLFKGYSWPKEPLWVFRGLGWLLMVVLVSEVLSSWMYEILHPYAIFDLSMVGMWALIPTILLYQLLVYAFHRALHDVPFLWRIHQTHHSVERLDIWSAYHVHPLEIVVWSFAGVLVSEGFLGVTAETSFWVSIFVISVQTFEHTNIRTPKWLGYFIARPENHMLHHAREKHHANYADLPIVDMLFGTFELAEDAPDAVGFWDGASREFSRKMLGKDISKPKQINQRI